MAENKPDAPAAPSAKAGAPKPPQAAPKKEEFGPDFRHLVRLVNTDLDGKRNVATALAYVPGVGKRLAYVVAREANVDPDERIGNLKDPEIAAVQTAIEGLTEMLPAWMVNRRKDPESGEDRHMVGTEIQIMLREDLNRLKKIRSWRGHRHEKKLPTRGQRTKNNGRFGSAVGVQRKVEGAPAAGEAAPAGGAPPAAPKAPGGGGAKPLGGAKPAAPAAPAAGGGAKPAAPAGGAKPAAPAGGKK